MTVVASAGWKAFCVLRQEPARAAVHRHGNWKHGDYSRKRIEGMRALRACIRDLGSAPKPKQPIYEGKAPST